MVSRSIFRFHYYIQKKRNKHNSCTQDVIMRHVHVLKFEELAGWMEKSRKCVYWLLFNLTSRELFFVFIVVIMQLRKMEIRKQRN